MKSEEMPFFDISEKGRSQDFVVRKAEASVTGPAAPRVRQPGKGGHSAPQPPNVGLPRRSLGEGGGISPLSVSSKG
jgi:hypothetical protein